MKGTTIVLIDLNPSTNVGCTLRDIVESCSKLNACVQYEPIENSESVFCDLELSGIVSRRQTDLTLLVLSSYHLKQAEALFQSMKSDLSNLPTIVAIETCKPDEMFSLLKFGVADFITPPFRKMDILPRLWRLLEHKKLEQTLNYKLKEKLGLKQMVGESFPFLDAIKKIPIVAKCDASVLISGETGTGKQMCARAIHYLSPRASKPFISFNCGAIPTELMENELFGHIQGAFTGASAPQPGLISAADSGTLLLDDIDCLPPAGQVKLLHFLQEKEYRQLGSPKMYQADVRILAATNIDLDEALKGGKLRQDLYYRINIIPLMLPALRDRREDIPLLARHFLRKYSIEFNKETTGFTAEALQTLTFYDWPGNVRELEHVIERAVLFAEQSVIREIDIMLPRQKTPAREVSFKEAKANVINEFERNYIEKVLIAYQGNISKAAQAAQKNRRAFWQLIQKHQIDVQALKPG